MKSKFYLCALFCAVVGTSVISSCKDTDEDLYLDIKNQLQKEDQKVEDLKDKVDGIQDQLDELNPVDITEVNIVSVYNPAFGTFSLPLDIQSNVLMGYYGSVASSDMFPAFADPSELAALGTAPESYDLTSDVNLEIGEVVLGINPLGNYTGLTPVLMTSKGVQNAVELSALKSYDGNLTWGYTRAGEAAFYVTSATVKDLDTVEKINLSDLKDDAKDIKDAVTGKGVDATKIAAAVYDIVNKKLAKSRNAISLTSANKYTIVSKPDLAVVMMNPIGFSTANTLLNNRYVDKLEAWAKIKKLTATVKVEDKTGTATFNVPNSIHRVLKKVADFVGDLYPRTFPALLAAGADGVKLLSADEANPTEVASTFNLHATSFTAEALVPFAKKFVAVTKINGAAADAAKNEALSKDLNKVVNGKGDLKIELSGLESGAVYEVAYSAMDYNGSAMTQKFYFKVK